jgi:hypothetical protein
VSGEGWTLCAHDDCDLTAFNGHDFCPEHAALEGPAPTLWALLVWDTDTVLERIQAVGSREQMEARAAAWSSHSLSVTVELVHDTATL